MLATLPEELIANVLSFLHNPPLFPPLRTDDGPHANVPALDTLRSISLTSRQLHRLVEPVLYYSYDGMLYNYTSLRMFLRTLLERPELGKQVRDLNVGTTGVEKIHQLLPHHLARVSELGLSDSLAADLASQISEQDCEDADETLLMALCPNVRKLKFCFYYWDQRQTQEPSLPRQFLEEVSAAHARVTNRELGETEGNQSLHALSNTFRSLTEIAASYSGSPRELSEYIPLLRLPALETFTVHGVACSDGLFGNIDNDPLTVQHLVLTSETRWTGIKCSALPGVFKRCPALRKLSLNWPIQTMATRSWRLCETNELNLLGHVLRDHGSGLEELTLQWSTCVPQLHGTLQAAGLRTWPRLRKLRAPEAMLLHDVGWVEDIPNDPLTACLPPTLEYLELYDCSTDEHISLYTEAQIAELVNDERFAALREVWVWREGSESATDAARKVRQRARNVASKVAPD